VTSPTPSPQPQEQIAFQDILDAYKEQVADLNHQLVLATCRIKNRDETIEALHHQLEEPRKKMARDLPDTPH